jgi:hypothetical protein
MANAIKVLLQRRSGFCNLSHSYSVAELLFNRLIKTIYRTTGEISFFENLIIQLFFENKYFDKISSLSPNSV